MFALRRVYLLFLSLGLTKQRSILTTGYSLGCNFFLGSVTASFFLSDALALLSLNSLFRTLMFSALLLSETVKFLHFPSFLLRSNRS
ncbi:hypothetical protein PF008_g27956 [Phytophthora fragariae]|nr:hypothetical protein PR002_g18961 [Phytophthora rubi]KAE9281161.1 hypothetical protein PF008_g27956 [Phytophthora fragariae]